jgi:hypothetical protein
MLYKEDQMKRTDTIILVIISLGLLVSLWAAWYRPSITGSLSNTILILTGAVVLWYTRETARIRRDAESRSLRDSLPKVYFDVQQVGVTQGPTDRERLIVSPCDSADAVVEYPLRFQIVNNSENFGFALILIRGKFRDRIKGLPRTGEYGGKRVWEITPFFRLNGWFNLLEIVSEMNAMPSGPAVSGIQVSAQLDLYDATGRWFSVIMKEYAVLVDTNGRVTHFFPETGARNIPRVEAPQRIENSATILFHQP